MYLSIIRARIFLCIFNNRVQVSSYDLSSGKENAMPEMKFARANFTSTLHGNYIYVFGGSDQYGPMDSCER